MSFWKTALVGEPEGGRRSLHGVSGRSPDGQGSMCLVPVVGLSVFCRLARLGDASEASTEPRSGLNLFLVPRTLQNMSASAFVLTCCFAGFVCGGLRPGGFDFERGVWCSGAVALALGGPF